MQNIQRLSRLFLFCGNSRDVFKKALSSVSSNKQSLTYHFFLYKTEPNFIKTTKTDLWHFINTNSGR